MYEDRSYPIRDDRHSEKVSLQKDENKFWWQNFYATRDLGENAMTLNLITLVKLITTFNLNTAVDFVCVTQECIINLLQFAFESSILVVLCETCSSSRFPYFLMSRGNFLDVDRSRIISTTIKVLVKYSQGSMSALMSKTRFTSWANL